MGDVRKTFKRFARPAETDQPGVAPTDDDLELMLHIYRHRLIESRDLYPLFPNRDKQVISRRLMRLYRTGYIDRPLAQNARTRITPGSRHVVYAIDKEGAQAVGRHVGFDVPVSGWKQKNANLSATSIEHHLETSRFVAGLAAATLRHDDIQLRYADQLIPREIAEKRPAGLFNTLRADVDYWSVPGKGEGTAPDAIVSLERGETGHVFLIEIDRGTETIEPGKRQREGDRFWRSTSFLRKFLIYSAAFKARAHETQLGLPPFRVLTVTTQPNRVVEMQRCFEAHMSEGALKTNPGLFLFTDWQTLTQSGDYLGPKYVNAANKTTMLIGG